MNFPAKVIVAYTHNVSEPAIRVHKLPKPGETVRAIGCNTGLDGGKGTNVAISMARLGIPTALVAHVKSGPWYTTAKQLLEEEHIDDTFVVCDADEKKSGGCVLIDDEGQNMIVLGSQNHQVIRPEEIDRALTAMKDARYCVTGYELNADSVHHILEKARERGIKTVLNPSPVPDWKPTDWDLVSLLVVNETEARYMLTLAGASFDPNNWEECMYRLREAYHCGDVVLTLGGDGFCSLEGDTVTRKHGIRVSATDTTGAGDGFLGAMVARLTVGDTLGDACSWANQFSSITVQRAGTISSYPTAQEVTALFPELAPMQQ